MDRKPPFRRKTAISYKTEEKTVMRGTKPKKKPSCADTI
jgi:hypothetical protein